ncbi:hypothetical protein NDU88_005124 [Pleurodeles waltl]|uniref:Uncharacterized protein n=1 Tax=Pleurodeles waltl TaxID=8319 RepID=A0AAV7L0B7_PLEWA|nr:hypothetical protein NDU88_005124 [Pleurodeles waltl]
MRADAILRVQVNHSCSTSGQLSILKCTCLASFLRVYCDLRVRPVYTFSELIVEFLSRVPSVPMCNIYKTARFLAGTFVALSRIIMLNKHSQTTSGAVNRFFFNGTMAGCKEILQPMHGCGRCHQNA